MHGEMAVFSMPTSSITVVPCLLLLLLAIKPAEAQNPQTRQVATNQFQEWYPQYGFVFEHFLHQNCSEQYARYLTGYRNQSLIDWYGGGGTLSVLTQAVTNCILDNTSQYLMATMTSSQVLLGITPTILSILGASSDETGMLWVVGRRPVLSVLLAAGSPSLYLSRAFEHRDPTELLRPRAGIMPPWRPGSSSSSSSAAGAAAATVAAVEYLLAAVAVANVVHALYQLGLQTICIFWSDGIVAPTVWWALGVAPHVGGAIVARLRVRRVAGGAEGRILRGGHAGTATAARADLLAAAAAAADATDRTGRGWRPGRWLLGLPAATWDMVRRTEGRPCVTQGPVMVRRQDEGPVYIGLSWLLSVGTVVHTIFGTMVLASTLFIGPRDALGVIGRLMASVLTCRAVLMYELSGLRDAYNRTRRELREAGVDDDDGHGARVYCDEYCHAGGHGEKTSGGVSEVEGVRMGGGVDVGGEQARPRSREAAKR